MLGMLGRSGMGVAPFLIIAVGLLVACPGAGVLEIEGVLPAEGHDHVALATKVRITFKEAVDGATVGAHSVKLVGPSGAVEATLAVEEGRTVVVTPAAPLALGTTYAIKVGTGVRTPAGAALAKPFESHFTTGSPKPLTAGAAGVDVTPPVGVPLAGYGSGGRRAFPPDFRDDNYHTYFNPSKGVHDPLIAKALVLSDGMRKVAFLKLDLVAIEKDAVADIAARIAKETGITPDNLFVSATHNHCGTGAITKTAAWQLIAVDAFHPKVYEHLISRAAKAVVAADKARVPAKLGVGTATEARIQRNRRGHEGHFDTEVGILKVEKATGEPLAVLVNFAMHPIAFPSAALLVSSDVVGVAEKAIEEGLGPGTVALWVQGAEGDVSPKYKGVDGMTLAGGMLAETVLAAVKGIKTSSAVDFDVAETTVTFRKPRVYLSCSRPSDHEAAALLGELNFCDLYKLFRGGDLSVSLPLDGLIGRTFPFKALRIGKETVVLFVPGEPITDIGLALKAGAKALGFEKALVFGLSNDHMSYIVSAKAYDEGGYEAIANFYGKDEGEIVTKTLLGLAAKLAPGK